MNRAAAVFVAALCALADFASANITPAPPTPRTYVGRQYGAELVIGVIGDVQNYCSTSLGEAVPGSPTAEEIAEGPRQLDILTADVIAMRPDFVIQVGDIADQSGSNAGDNNDPDNFTTSATRYSEMPCIRAHLFDRLDDAGIPWIAATGNHDSYRDFERAFPRSEFLAKDYAYAAQNEVNRWHVGFSDTDQRAALFQTQVGPVCAVTVDYLNTSGEPANTTDEDWINANVGCGGDHPTILVRHYGTGNGSTSPPLVTANYKTFVTAYGHMTSGYGTFSQSVVYNGGFEMTELFQNGQEAYTSCGSYPDTAVGNIHTGVGWWALLRVLPTQSRVTVQGRDALRGGDHAHRCNYYNVGYSAVVSPPFCTRFPEWIGCDLGLLPDTTAPTAPTSLSSNAGEYAMTLEWDDSTDAVGVAQYLIEQCTGAACSPTVEVGGSPTASYYTGVVLESSTTYGFRIRARDGSGNMGPYSSTYYASTVADSTPPFGPTFCQAEIYGGEALVRWGVAIDFGGIDHYEIERCSGDGCTGFAWVADHGTETPLSWYDEGLPSGTYRYRVRAEDPSGNEGSYCPPKTLIVP